MHIGYTDQQEALRQELRSYYARLLTPEVEEQLAHSQGVGPVHRQIVRHMGEDGWLGVGWPKEYGGRGFTAVEQFVFFDESMRAGAPVPMLTINTVGPTIMEFGSQEQRDFFLPRILKGEIHFCIGYSEPGAGTDLAALKKAVSYMPQRFGLRTESPGPRALPDYGRVSRFPARHRLGRRLMSV